VVLSRTLLLTCLFLSGCAGWVVPVPVPQSAGPTRSSRANLDERTQDRVIATQTTRTQLLLLLGEPDGRGPEDSWFAYGTVARRGGIKWEDSFMVHGNPNSSQRLLINFDSQGVVSAVEFTQRDCAEEQYTCLEATGGDLLAVDDAQINATGKILAQYDPIILDWRSSQRCTLKPKSYYDAGHGDAFVVTEQAIFWRDQSTAPRWRTLSISDVQDIPWLQDDGAFEWIAVQKLDGSCLLFNVGIFADPNGLSQAQQLRSFLTALVAHQAEHQT
jgi:hypothetical protein